LLKKRLRAGIVKKDGEHCPLILAILLCLLEQLPGKRLQKRFTDGGCRPTERGKVR
jgi:hypothetical protein